MTRNDDPHAAPGPLDAALVALFNTLGDPAPTLRFRDLDTLWLTGRGGALVLVCSHPSMGRSAFVGQLAAQSAYSGRVAMYCIDLPASQVLSRVLTVEARVDAARILRREMNDRDAERLAHAAGRLTSADLHLVEAYDMTPQDIVQHAQAMHAEHPLSMVVVDGLELLEVKPGAEMDAALRDLRRLSRALGCPVLVTLPLGGRPERRVNSRPLLSDLEIAPAAEGMADAILGMYRDEVVNAETDSAGVAEVILLKQKVGPTGRVRLHFHGPQTRFNDLAPEDI